MHLLTGLLLGEMALTAGVLKGRFGRRAIPFELVHAVPGRVRFRVARVLGDAAAGGIVAGALERLDGVRDAAADARSGSVTVRFDESNEVRHAIIQALGVLTAAPAAPGGGGKTGTGGAAAPASGEDEPLLRRQVQALGRALDQNVLSQTGGLTDLQTLVAFLAALWGAKTLLVPDARGRWPGLTLLYWAYNMLRR